MTPVEGEAQCDCRTEDNGKFHVGAHLFASGEIFSDRDPNRLFKHDFDFIEEPRKVKGKAGSHEIVAEKDVTPGFPFSFPNLERKVGIVDSESFYMLKMSPHRAAGKRNPAAGARAQAEGPANINEGFAIKGDNSWNRCWHWLF